MKTYEITFITKEEPKDSVKEILESFGGKILKTSSLGQKNFVYPIKKEKSGIYTSYFFSMDAEKIQILNRKLDMEEIVLRHLIIVIKPSQEFLTKQNKEAQSTEIELKPEMEIMAEPEKAIEIEPEKSLDKTLESEIVKVEEPVNEEKAEEKTEKPAKKITKKEKTENTEETPEPKISKEKVKKPAKTEIKVEGVNKEANKAVNEVINEEERLEALDKKLEELLKD